MRRLERTATDADAGRKIKYFVRGDMGVSSRQFGALKMTGGLRVNGEIVHADYILKESDFIEVLLEDRDAVRVTPDPAPMDVVYEDEDILIIDKPAPLACQCSPKQTAMTLENRLAHRYPGMTFRPLNRLDKGTSGLMAAAKHPHAAQILQKQLHTDAFLREYLAVAVGRMDGEGVIDAPIAKAPAATVRRAVDFENGVRAVTHYQAVQSGERYSLVRLRLETGRTHQIRVHLAWLGHPIAGDFLYGAEDARLPGRFALHSTRIRLIQPVTGAIIERNSPLPDALAAFIEP